MADLSYDPTEFSSKEDYARSRAAMDREFGMPRQPYTGEVGRLVNAEHHKFESRMNDDLGWHTSKEALRKKWDL